nr:NRDE family protein [Allomuricauda sp.]
MCTVSFIAQNGSYFITSNRDEHISRPKSFAPKEQTINSVRVLFPKDAKAGGTWFAINENEQVGVLLNGGFVPHESKGPYAKSRGLVLLEIIGSDNPLQVVKDIDLKNIEPFTLVLFVSKELVEFRWDGNKKYFSNLDSERSYIWSSVTLYDETAIEVRNRLFSKFVRETTTFTPDKVVDFHSNNHEDFENGFIIDRTTGLKTFSVTQAILSPGKTKLKHFDLLGSKKYEVDFESRQLVTSIK